MSMKNHLLFNLTKRKKSKLCENKKSEDLSSNEIKSALIGRSGLY